MGGIALPVSRQAEGTHGSGGKGGGRYGKGGSGDCECWWLVGGRCRGRKAGTARAGGCGLRVHAQAGGGGGQESQLGCRACSPCPTCSAGSAWAGGGRTRGKGPGGLRVRAPPPPRPTLEARPNAGRRPSRRPNYIGGRPERGVWPAAAATHTGAAPGAAALSRGALVTGRRRRGVCGVPPLPRGGRGVARCCTVRDAAATHFLSSHGPPGSGLCWSDGWIFFWIEWTFGGGPCLLQEATAVVAIMPVLRSGGAATHDRRGSGGKKGGATGQRRVEKKEEAKERARGGGGPPPRSPPRTGRRPLRPSATFPLRAAGTPPLSMPLPRATVAPPRRGTAVNNATCCSDSMAAAPGSPHHPTCGR